MTKKPTLFFALDYGIKKTGMAIGNDLSGDTRPFAILAMDNGQPDWENLLGMIEAWDVKGVVVGLPLHMDGSDSMLSRRAAKFARRLAHRLGERRMQTAVYLSDERLSSRQARQIAYEQDLIKSGDDPIDDVAACLILSDFLRNPDKAKPVGDAHA